MKDFFNSIAKAASVYLDPYGESELNRIERADKKFNLDNLKNYNTFNTADWPHKKEIAIFSHEIAHIAYENKIEELKNSPKKFRFTKPVPNIGIMPPDTAPVASVPAALIPETTAAQRAAQVATVMAEGVQGKVAAPKTARFRK